MAHQYNSEVLMSVLNPDYCISRSDVQDRIALKNNNFPEGRSTELFWETQGNIRINWQKVGDREYEIRVGGTLLLRGYSIDARILEFSELLANWEKYAFKEPMIPIPG
jgi:hypothetical protein